MSEDDGQEKTHDPSAKRRKEFREKGQVPKSQEVLQSLGLAIGGLVIWSFIGSVGDGIGQVLSVCYVRIPSHEFDVEAAAEIVGAILMVIAGMLMPIVGLMWSFVLVVTAIQGRGAFPKEPFKFDPQKFNIFSAIKEKYLSPKPFLEAFKALVKLFVIGGLVIAAMWDRIGLFPALVTAEPASVLLAMEEIAFVIFTRALPVAFTIAVIDYSYEWYRIWEKMKMTREEVKEEQKSTDGDPHIKAHRRKRQFEIAMARSIRDVQKADVVITNPTHYAVALRYRKDEAPAPVVVALGIDAWALKIRAEASRHDIPQIENRALARALYADCQRNRMIPEEMFGAVAKVLAVIIRRRQRFKGGRIKTRR